MKHPGLGEPPRASGSRFSPTHAASLWDCPFCFLPDGPRTVGRSPVTGRDSSDEGLDSAQIADVGTLLQGSREYFTRARGELRRMNAATALGPRSDDLGLPRSTAGSID